jgi:hypothetical protein
VPLVASPVQADEQPIRFLVPVTRGQRLRNDARGAPSHAGPGRVQHDMQRTPQLIVSPGWPLQKNTSSQIVELLRVDSQKCTPDQRRRILGNDPVCVWCHYKSPVKNPEDRRREFQVDHIIAARRPSNDRINVMRPVCNLCKFTRGNKPASRWREWATKSKQLRERLGSKPR